MEEGTDDEVLYVERRGAGLLPWGLILMPPGVVLWSAVTDPPGADDSMQAYVIGVVLMLLWGAAIAWFMWSRWGPSWKHVVVSRSGLLVGREFLPADRIGDVRLVASSAAKTQSFTGRLGGTSVGYSTYGWMASDGHGVMVEDLEGGRKPLWLFASDDPIGVIEALDLVTGRRRRAFELEVPDPQHWLEKGAERSRKKGRRHYERRKATRG